MIIYPEKHIDKGDVRSLKSQLMEPIDGGGYDVEWWMDENRLMRRQLTELYSFQDEKYHFVKEFISRSNRRVIYCVWDSENRLPMYVGCSGNLHSRMMHHYRKMNNLKVKTHMYNQFRRMYYSFSFFLTIMSSPIADTSELDSLSDEMFWILKARQLNKNLLNTRKYPKKVEAEFLRKYDPDLLEFK